MKLKHNPTVAMWSNRFSRLGAAWGDGESKPRKLIMNAEPALWLMLFFVFAVVCFFIFSVNANLDELSPDLGAELLKQGGYISLIAVITFFLGKNAAILDAEQGYFFEYLKVQWICYIIASSVTLSIIIGSSSSGRPVAQETYSKYKANYPTCHRFNDYLVYRQNTATILTNHDMTVAEEECKNSDKKLRLLAQQKTLK
jgi:hypothetical protein